MPVTPLAGPGAALSASVAASFRAVSLLQIAIIVSKVKGSLLGWFICFLVAGNCVDKRGGVGRLGGGGLGGRAWRAYARCRAPNSSRGLSFVLAFVIVMIAMRIVACFDASYRIHVSE
jgi:hypothetical protein